MTDNNMGTTDTLNPLDQEDLVEVIFARNSAEARACVRELLSSDIPARMESGRGMGGGYGVAVLVPSDRLILASEILAAKAQDDDEEEEEEFEDDEEEVDDADDDFEDEDDDFDDDEDDDADDDDDEEDEDEFEDDDDF